MASIRTSYPIKFNTTEIPFPNSYSESFQTVESVMQTEAGTDVTTVARYKKLKVSMSFVCLQATVQTLAGFETLDSFTFKRYNPKVGNYEEKTVRMRKFKYNLKKGSEDLSSVNGVWQVSFELEEF